MNWDNISKYILDEMSDAERSAFEEQMQQDSGLMEAVDESRKNMEQIDRMNKNKHTYNVDKAWDKLNHRITSSEPKRMEMPLLARYAAAIILVFGLSLAGFWGYQQQYKNTVSTRWDDAGKKIELPDGSLVTLNANSKLTYPRQFGQMSREVRLRGEAFFEVVRNEAVPFIVYTNQTEVKVLGTQFNVDASGENTSVFVTTGKVQVSSLKHKDQLVTLEKGEYATLKNDQLLKSMASDQNLLSWKTQLMVFEDTPISEVCKVIERTYGVQVQLPENLQDSLHLTSTFEHEPLNIILESIGKSFNLTYKIEDRKVVYSR